MEIILGTEGNQPFSIKASGASRRHARLTINEQSHEWTLEDLNSTNGTFIRNENTGELIQIGKTTITPTTFISLGPDNSKGCCFYALQVQKENCGNYYQEYEYMNDKEDEFEEQLRRVERNDKNLNIVKAVLPIGLLALSFAIVPTMGPVSWIIRGAASAIPTIAILLFYNPSEIKKQINVQRERFHHCPNPNCSHKLKTNEIRNLKCSKCKK